MAKKFYLLTGIIIILSFLNIEAQDFDPTTIPERYGSTNFGTDFWLTFHPNYQAAQSSNSIRLYVTSLVETSVKVEVPGKGYQAQLNTIPNNTIQFDISITIGQPFSGGMSLPPPIEQVYDGAGIHVTSDDPIVVFGLARGSGSSDGYMAIPISTWGKEYIIASWADGSNNETEFRPSYVSVIAAYDNTRVSFILGGNSGTQTEGGMQPGELKQFTLYSGDVLVIPSMGTNSDLSGSKVLANKPVAVVSGNRCAAIPETENNCDYLIEQELPTQVWGNEFHIGPINKRKKNPIIKMMSKEESNKIYKNGIQIATIKYIGGMENDGWLRMRSDDNKPAPVTIRSEKPSCVTLFNPSRSEDTVNIDPFQMLMIPVEQYQKEVFFTTPSAKNYIEFPTNFVNIIFESDDIGTVPEDLEYAQESNGKMQWEKVNLTSPAPGSPFIGTQSGKRYYLKQFQLPAFGTYKIRASKPLMVYSYGYSANASYGYPASSVLSNFEKSLDDMIPVPTYTVECDGTVDNASIEDYPQNNDRSNLSVVCYQNNSSFNYNFTYGSFMPGEKNKINWNLSVKDRSKDARAVITFGDRTGHDTTVIVNYFVRKPVFNPKTLDLGLVRVGNNDVTGLWLNNQSTSSPLILNNVFLKNNDRGFEILDSNLNVISLPLIIAPSDSFKLMVKFTGVQAGVFSDSIGISDDCNTWILGYVKSEAGKPKIAVSDFNFPDTYLQTKISGQISIRNQGNYNLVITGYNPPTEPAFSYVLQEISESKPLVIGPGQIFTFEAMFQPVEEKEYIDSIVFVNDASETDPTTILTGKGVIKVGVDEKDFTSSGLSIYPNPADYKLIVRIDNSVQFPVIRIFDVYGNCVIEKISNYEGNGIVLNVSDLSIGVYYLVLISNQSTLKSRFNIIH
ncbi:MAG: T9SS type A sorting domain-containing protein [Ignavibacteriae bacterium]|nr:T9SS type A sorting domain-containing protein [Ignavibacteriota bacterium]